MCFHDYYSPEKVTRPPPCPTSSCMFHIPLMGGRAPLSRWSNCTFATTPAATTLTRPFTAADGRFEALVGFPSGDMLLYNLTLRSCSSFPFNQDVSWGT